MRSGGGTAGKHDRRDQHYRNVENPPCDLLVVAPQVGRGRAHLRQRELAGENLPDPVMRHHDVELPFAVTPQVLDWEEERAVGLCRDRLALAIDGYRHVLAVDG